MRLEDRRPAFAGLANLTEQQLQSLPTPCYLLDEAQLRRNGQIMLELQQRTGCRALLAQKAFSNFDVYPVLAPYLAGTEASGLYESRLGREQLPEKENHVFCAAYRADEFAELLQYADHIVFNSPGQLAQFGPAAKAAGKSVGLRVNPECSTQEGHAIYDPCAPGSRLGTTRAQWDAAVAAHPELPELLDGLHFHTLCEQDADALAVTLKAVEATFGDLLPKMKWVNFGGGHHVTRPGYDLATLEQCICQVQAKYGVRVYLEPGEAWALNAGYLITTVLDTLQNGDTRLAILDMSAACHTPDVIEMPYRPPLLDAGDPGEKPCTVRLGGPTCLAGDVMGDYSFKAPLAPGQRLVLGAWPSTPPAKTPPLTGCPCRISGFCGPTAVWPGWPTLATRISAAVWEAGERAPWAQHLSKFKGTVSARKTAPASGPVAGNSKRQRFFAKFGMTVTIAQQISPAFVTFSRISL